MQGQDFAAAGMQQATQRHVSSYHVALIYCFLGEKEKAIECLERPYAEREAWPVWTGVEPVFDSLRDNPRFSALLQKTNNPAAAVQA